MMVAVGRWLVFGGGHQLKFNCIQVSTIFQVISPSNAFVVISVEVRECSGTQVRAAVGGLQGVAASDAHAPEHHATRRLLLTLDFKTT